MLIRSAPTTRRAALAAGVWLGVGGVTAGCTMGRSGGEPPGIPGDAEPSPEPPADADTQLVDGVADRIRQVAVLVEAALAAHPVLRERQRALRRVHRAHLEVLDARPDTRPDTRGGRGGGPAPATPADAVRLVRRQETGLQRFLTDAAVAAGSGALATLLASMSAAVAQQLTVLG